MVGARGLNVSLSFGSSTRFIKIIPRFHFVSCTQENRKKLLKIHDVYDRNIFSEIN